MPFWRLETGSRAQPRGACTNRGFGTAHAPVGALLRLPFAANATTLRAGPHYDQDAHTLRVPFLDFVPAHVLSGIYRLNLHKYVRPF